MRFYTSNDHRFRQGQLSSRFGAASGLEDSYPIVLQAGGVSGIVRWFRSELTTVWRRIFLLNSSLMYMLRLLQILSLL